jgi:hypothetical protein
MTIKVKIERRNNERYTAVYANGKLITRQLYKRFYPLKQIRQDIKDGTDINLGPQNTLYRAGDGGSHIFRYTNKPPKNQRYQVRVRADKAIDTTDPDNSITIRGRPIEGFSDTNFSIIDGEKRSNISKSEMVKQAIGRAMRGIQDATGRDIGSDPNNPRWRLAFGKNPRPIIDYMIITRIR